MDDDFSRRCDGGVGFTDIDGSYLYIVFGADGIQNRPRHLDGTAPSLVDVDAGMTAQTTVDVDGVPPWSVHVLTLHGDAMELQTGPSGSRGDCIVIL